MVQFLETLFGAGTRGVRRMHQLANAVLIFDEVQSLPVNCVHLFNNAINFLADQCGSCVVVLCTATQPLLDKVDSTQGAIRLTPEAGELMPDVSGFRRSETGGCNQQTQTRWLDAEEKRSPSWRARKRETRVVVW